MASQAYDEGQIPFTRFDDVGWLANAVLGPVQNGALISTRPPPSPTNSPLAFSRDELWRFQRMGAADQLQVVPGAAANEQISALADALKTEIDE